MIISTRPLADLSPFPIAQGLKISHGRSKVTERRWYFSYFDIKSNGHSFKFHHNLQNEISVTYLKLFRKVQLSSTRFYKSTEFVRCEIVNKFLKFLGCFSVLDNLMCYLSNVDFILRGGSFAGS